MKSKSKLFFYCPYYVSLARYLSPGFRVFEKGKKNDGDGEVNEEQDK